MLLRSSSTPILECLPPPQYTDSFVDTRNESSLIGEAPMAKSISLSTNCQSTAHPPCLHGMSCDSAAPPLQAVRGKDPGSSPHPALNRVRKVQSESDLSSLGGSLSSARVAADTLLSDDYDEHEISLYHFSGRKSTSGLRLSRGRSLGSLPMDLPSVFFSGGSSAILEEVEPSSFSSTSSEGDAIESVSCAFDKVALPVTDSKHKVGIFQWNNVHDDDDDNGIGTVPQLFHGLPRMKSGDVAYLTSPADAGVSNSGRQGLEQSAARTELGTGYGGGADSTTLVKESCGQVFGSNYGGDQVEVALGGDDCGRGARPPSVGAGGGGGGSDGYGHGVDMTDLHYKNMLKENPGHPLLLRNYAQFLADVKREFDRAEEYYQRAILASPTDGELLGQYAKMIWDVQHDRERVATYFERAVQAASDNSYVMAAYASFLWSSEEEEEEESLKDSASKVPTLLSLVHVGLA